LRVILGIGNPGKKYENTRHNIGFMILDEFARNKGMEFVPSKNDYYIAGSPKKASPFCLIKPTTYVNLSGQAAVQVLDEYLTDPNELLIVSDDINLPLGKLRIRKSGGDGGHNGLNSIIYSLNTDQFARLRFGVGNEFENGAMANYVLNKFTKEEIENINESISLSLKLIDEFIDGGSEKMLTSFSKINNDLLKVSNIDKKEGN
jgi:PTH1 family peptidyl-tRNA hydrolase